MSSSPSPGFTTNLPAALAASDTSWSTVDAASTPGFDRDKDAGKELMSARGKILSELQERLYACGKSGDHRSVLLVLQGMDTSGKGGMVRHVLGMVEPQGVDHATFGTPTEEERAHPFLWRVEKKLPRPGQIGVFDRSHYEDVLIVRVNELAPPSVWRTRYDEINDFERRVVESGTTIVKVAMALSWEQQGKRLARRLRRPDKYWKYDPSDIEAREKWVAYQEAYQAVLDRTDTEWAPWYVVPSDHKWYSRLAVTELLTGALTSLDLQWPPADFDVEHEKQRLASLPRP
ncbi:polyphosphate kinase 2 family protein [Rhodococcus sp. BP-332]|uniref:PPK2 family polyphosphate kinase n=1 Tax=Rhodococcus sp. BP-332 TaxID=2739447 RepID=UPI001C9AADC1|nr:PPK2 family polyphosphate kinase [Rhodococcus sp. BP-332]MBY6676969.1 polyphosphate kinase 2 family protein [Rhodococcus sp. BP-332]